mmetsp:Transcript_56822/g.158230  ORF Transcript_56822/g.158230 Transcript_56822/m.158230 type:complete len:442 (-) Transcript_56822:141-1466(-)
MPRERNSAPVCWNGIGAGRGADVCYRAARDYHGQPRNGYRGRWGHGHGRGAPVQPKSAIVVPSFVYEHKLEQRHYGGDDKERRAAKRLLQHEVRRKAGKISSESLAELLDPQKGGLKNPQEADAESATTSEPCLVSVVEGDEEYGPCFGPFPTSAYDAKLAARVYSAEEKARRAKLLAAMSRAAKEKLLESVVREVVLRIAVAPAAKVEAEPSAAAPLAATGGDATSNGAQHTASPRTIPGDRPSAAACGLSRPCSDLAKAMRTLVESRVEFELDAPPRVPEHSVNAGSKRAEVDAEEASVHGASASNGRFDASDGRTDLGALASAARAKAFPLVVDERIASGPADAPLTIASSASSTRGEFVEAVSESVAEYSACYELVVHAFDGTDYGEECLSLKRGDVVRFSGREAAGWRLGQLLDTQTRTVVLGGGWYPPGCVQTEQ